VVKRERFMAWQAAAPPPARAGGRGAPPGRPARIGDVVAEAPALDVGREQIVEGLPLLL